MLLASFTDIEAARLHREKFGGWIFVPDSGNGATWFNWQMTPSTIMTHAITRGISGRLI
jgi:hypothetical protein